MNNVHNTLGNGFLEKVYQETLEIEFIQAGIPYQREVELPISYRNKTLNTKYRVDLICYDNVLLEIKALNQLSTIEEGQVINYLNASQLDKALLINFGSQELGKQRFSNSKNNLRAIPISN